MKKHESMSGVDAAWLRMDEPTNRMTITTVLVLHDPMDIGTLRALVDERLLGFLRFRQHVQDPHTSPHWAVDPHFDITQHVRRSALPGNGGRAELKERASELMSRPLDTSRPLWDFELIEDYQGGSAIIARIHHCIADGIALVHVLFSLTDEHFDAARFPTSERSGWLSRAVGAPVRLVRGMANTGAKLLEETATSLLRPKHVLHRAEQGMSLGAALSKLALTDPDSDTPFKGELGVAQQATWSDTIDLPTIKSVGHALDAKVNDVLLGAVAGALRYYLKQRGASTDDVIVRTLIPVNLRSKEKAFELGNRFGLVFLDLPVGLEGHIRRVRAVKRQMDEIKGSTEAVAAFGILETLGYLPIEAEDRAVRFFSNKASAVMTNVPGPREQLHLKGHRLQHVMPWVPRAGNIGLGVSIFSYAGDVRLGVACDAALVPDPDTILDGFREEFDRLVADTGAVDAAAAS